MKFTTVLAFIATATVVSASTNAERLARGLPLKAPVRRGSATHPHRSYPSAAPGSSECSTGPVHCCNSVQKTGQGNGVDELLNVLGLTVPANTAVGMNCSPISAIGVGGNSCTSQTVCCENNHFNGLVNIGCTPININL